MTSQLHTYGPTCLLYEREPEQSTSQDPNVIPPPPSIRSQFFYISPLPIDDPLTPLPAPSGNSASLQAKLPPRPFSVRDNIALEEAWQGLRGRTEISASGNGPQATSGQNTTSGGGSDSVRRRDKHGGLASGEQHDSSNILNSQKDITLRTPRDEKPADTGMRSTMQKRHSIPIPRRSKSPKHHRMSSPSAEEGGSLTQTDPSTPRTGRRARNTSVSGSPFIRAPIRHRLKPLFDTRMSSSEPGSTETSPERPVSAPRDTKVLNQDRALPEDQQSRSRSSSAAIKNEPEASVTVGASRLHQVELPDLQMKPIYWNPVNDVTPVLRATWFYKNTMLPVDPELANQLEAGYMYLKPWTQTWQEELNSCVENGADAELKIVHKLWQKETAIPSDSIPQTETTAHESPSARTSSEILPDFPENKAAGSVDLQCDAAGQFKNSSVIYVDSKEAQILRPNLLPSASRGRKPLSSIRKGRQIGVAVVRGFRRRVWDKLYPSKLPSTSARHFIKMRQSGLSDSAARQKCFACRMEDRKQNVNDLVLVVHGIGQKLSERVESYHFTHSINAFRRQVNIELSSETLSPHMRPDVESIMVLPVNWRSTLSLEDMDVEETLSADPNDNRFGLKDITPETIPAVRNLISDVMLDIPYYLSHHKPKMVRAVVREANRIYRLWCNNNPGFKEHGKVHMIAHSLGSVMALDILSHQPTIPPVIDFAQTEASQSIFEFDTKNLFLCGSPSGFFLLLNKSNLRPRKGRNKPDMENEDAARGIAGEAGTYGCLAVDNLYNIMHETDPIAYRLNAAVDTGLSSSLRQARVPTSATTFFQAMGSVFRWSSPRPLVSATVNPTSTQQRPSLTAKLPSNIELETHDFTREEIAETRMQLLNDNGQIDYFISGGGGPLNIQYLNMLSAHSSYWILPDFVRFLVLEVGRMQGKDGALVALRAEKKKGWKRVKV